MRRTLRLLHVGVLRWSKRGRLQTRRPIQNWSRKAGQIRPSRLRRAMLSSSASRIVFGRTGLNGPPIGADHSLARALRDFENLKALAAPNSIIAIHDVVPMTWMPQRQRRRPSHVPYRRNTTVFSTRVFCDFTEQPGVRRLPVTLLIGADEFCICQYVALHCSLDLRFRRVS